MSRRFGGFGIRRSAARQSLGGEVLSYNERVLALGPIAYWPMDETGGSTADNLEGTADRDGTYSGVTLDYTTFLNGDPAGRWDGANDYVDIYSPSFDGVFDGDEGTVGVWAKMFQASDWENGTDDRLLVIARNGSNYVIVEKATTNNTLKWFRYAGGVTLSEITKTGVSTTDWFHTGLTWSKSADEVRAYFNGSQEGATKTGLSAWTDGPLASNLCVIGSEDTAPSGVDTWAGHIWGAVVYDYALTPSQMASIGSL